MPPLLPSADTADGRVRYPCKLNQQVPSFTRASVAGNILRGTFANEKHFAHHQHLPDNEHFGDEGAANHTP